MVEKFDYFGLFDLAPFSRLGACWTNTVGARRVFSLPGVRCAIDVSLSIFSTTVVERASELASQPVRSGHLVVSI